jgi:SRSO17 transposase
MQAGKKKNMDRMAEVVPDVLSRNLQQFITHSKWDAREVMDHVAQDADGLLGDPRDGCLILDESGFVKQGKKSVGVSRQWLGRLGKVDNGQVAVYAVLAKGHHATLVDTRLYLPKSWTDDRERCLEAGVPESEIKFRTKEELAIEMVRHARAKAWRYGWVGTDAGYGKGPGFLFALDDLEERCVVDLHSDFKIYLRDPKPTISSKAKRSKDGSTIYQTDEMAVEVLKLVESVRRKFWKRVTIRDTTRGPLELLAYSQVVYVWDGKSERARCMHLLVTKMLDGTEIKISLVNKAKGLSLRRLAFMQRQRYWVERSFEDGKSECGMADYQVRKWSAWHHHMAMVMMVMLFMLTERINHADSHPLLSCADIEELLAKFLPRRDVTEKEVLRQLEVRHQQRQRAIDSHRRCAKKRKKSPVNLL